MCAEPAEPSDNGRARPGVQETTRLRYLEVAAELVAVDVASEPAFAHVASHVRMTAVAESLGVSRTSLYRQWPTQHDYWSDLVSFVIGDRSEDDAADPAREVDSEDAGPEDVAQLLELVRVDMAGVQERLVDDPGRILRTSLLGYPPIAPLAHQVAEGVRAERRRAAGRLDRLLAAAGRAVVAPLTTDDLVAAIWIFADGVAHCSAIDPSFVETTIDLDGRADAWSLTAFAARAVLATATEPGPPSRTPSAQRDVTAAPEHRRRWSPEQLAALQEGARLLVAHVRSGEGSGARPSVLGHVSLARLARAAGVSRRQLYHVWPSHDDLLSDLRAHLRAAEAAQYRRRFDDGLTAAIGQLDLSRIALDVCEHVNRGYQPWEDRPVLRPRFAFELHLADPAISADSTASLDRVMTFHQERIDALVGATGAALRPGVTTRHVNQLFTAGSHGAEVLHRLDPTAIRTGIPYRAGAYSVFSIGCQAIVDHALEPSAVP